MNFGLEEGDANNKNKLLEIAVYYIDIMATALEIRIQDGSFFFIL